MRRLPLQLDWIALEREAEREAECEVITSEVLDSTERKRGGKWRLSMTTLPGEEVIVPGCLN